MAARELADEGVGVIEDLAAFVEREASWYAADLHREWPYVPQDSFVSELRYFFDKGDLGSWLSIAYFQLTGRMLFIDTAELLQRYVADLRSDPARQLMCLSRDPGAQWQPVSDDQLSRIIPPAPLPANRRDRANALRDSLSSLMRDLAQDLVDFRGERCVIRIFRCAGQRAGQLSVGPNETEQSPSKPETATLVAGARRAAPHRFGPIPGEIDVIRQQRRQLIVRRLKPMQRGRYKNE
jgi:hypothetical protein